MRPKQPNRNSLVFPMRPKQPQQRLRRLSAVGRSRSWVWSKSGMVHPHLLSALPRLGDEEPRDLLPQSLPGQPDSPALESVRLFPLMRPKQPWRASSYESPSFDALPRISAGPPQRRAIAIHRMAPIEKPRLIKLPRNYLPFGKCTANCSPHTRALMILFCPSHAKLSSEIEILHVFFARGFRMFQFRLPIRCWGAPSCSP